jgi:hypothetical protein
LGHQPWFKFTVTITVTIYSFTQIFIFVNICQTFDQGILKVAIVLPPRRQICQVRQDSFGFLGALYKNLASLAVII